MIDVTKADLTGRGYRCTTCSLKASLAADGGQNDVRDHLTDDERRERYAAARQRMFTGGWIVGGGMLALFTVGALIGVPLVCLGLGTISHGYLTRREMTGERTH